MFGQRFRIGEEAKDLLKVVLHGNDLVSFLHSCNSVIAGMKIVPGRFAADSWVPEDQVRPGHIQTRRRRGVR